MSTDSRYSKPLFAGVDVGGTNIKIGVVDSGGQIVADAKFPTLPDESPKVAIRQARSEFDSLIRSAGFSWDDVVAAGLGTPTQG